MFIEEFVSEIAGEALFFGLSRLIDYLLVQNPISIRPRRDTICINDVHDPEMVEKMIEQKIKKKACPLRHRWDLKELDLNILNTLDRHEYMVNTHRLVVTLLTDRCYAITLTQSFYLIMAGVPAEPESSLRMMVYVFHYSEQMDFRVVQQVKLLEARHSVFIIGLAGTGKTEMWKTLYATSSGSVFNYFIDPEPKQFIPWLDLVSSFELNPDTRLQQTLVNTIETTRIRYFLNLLVDKKKAIMLAGANDNRKSLSNDLNAVVNVPLNLYTISEMLQKILEKSLEKKAGRNFYLPDGKTLIYFIDDINMPEQTLVNTIETTKIRYFLNLLVDKKKAIMLAGANDNRKSLSNDLNAVVNVPLNLYTISEMLQRILEKALEKKAGRNFDLPDGKTLIYFIDDINMPEINRQSSLEIDRMESYRNTETLEDRNTCVVLQTMKKLPINTKNYHPVQLLNEMIPGLRYYVTVISNPPADILVRCIVHGSLIEGRASTKKKAQRKIAVRALEIFYGVRFKN